MTTVPISWMLKQTAVYWAPTGVGAYGKPTWGTPVEVDCRWQDVTEEFVDAFGTRLVSNAKVYLGQEVEVKGVLLLGDLSSGSTVDQDDPMANDGAWEVRRFDKMPDIPATKFLLTAFL